MVVVGVDTGGTFTDFVYLDGERWHVYKVISTPSNPAKAVLRGLRHIAANSTTAGPMQIVHGSTIATNALLERKGARTVLITNKGFEDVIEIGRQNRTRLYDLAYRKPPHIVPQDARMGIRGRILSSGEVLEDLDTAEALELSKKIRNLGAESIAVSLLFSYVNPTHENQVREVLKELGMPISLSHEVLSEFREFERTSTTVINSYVSPKVKNYLSHLIASLEPTDRVRIMQSNGGSISAKTAMTESVRTILSGPAGGVVGALELGRMAGHAKLITFDMGGTSTDVSLVDEKVSITLEACISGYPIKVPMIDIHTVGAGGGSIAYVDSGGSLRVGPESAGADPGPICYGSGENITVTDANLFLGRLMPDHFLGGQMKLDPGRLPKRFDRMSSQMGLSPLDLAEGILAVVNSAMEKAIRVISVERGYDPREFTLFSFGGAAGLHAAFLARLLDIPRVLIPRDPGILSAIGMLMADIVKDYSRTVMLDEDRAGPADLVKVFDSLEKVARAELAAEGVPAEGLLLERYLDMRCHGQSYEIIVPFLEGYVEGFHQLHEKTYGYRNSGKTVEIVNIRLRARGIPRKPEFKKIQEGNAVPPLEAFIDQREVVIDSERHKLRVLARDKLLSGNRIAGPAVITEYSSTTLVPSFAEASMDDYGNLIVEIVSL